MKTYKVWYRWQSREYQTLSTGCNAAHALTSAEIVSGGQVFGVEAA